MYHWAVVHIQNVAIIHMEKHSFIYSFSFKYLLNFCYKLKIISGVANSVVNLFCLYILVMEKDDKDIHE